MGKLEARQRLTVVRRLCGHDAMGPNGVLVQSMDRIRLPISPPPTSQFSGLVSSWRADVLRANCWRDMRSFLAARFHIGRDHASFSQKSWATNEPANNDSKKCSEPGQLESQHRRMTHHYSSCCN